MVRLMPRVTMVTASCSVGVARPAALCAWRIKSKVREALDAQRTRMLPSPGPKGESPGLLTPGNIDLAARPVLTNADGSISTVRSMSFEEDDGTEILVPTISPEGHPLTDDEAIDLYRQTGLNLGKFDSPAHATAYAERLHEAQDEYYTAKRSGVGDIASVGLEAAVDNILAEGVFRNGDDGYVFLNPYNGLAVAGADGKPLTFTLDEITKADADLAGAARAGEFVGKMVKPRLDAPRRAPTINETIQLGMPNLTGAGRPAPVLPNAIPGNADVGIRDALMGGGN